MHMIFPRDFHIESEGLKYQLLQHLAIKNYTILYIAVYS